MQKQSSRIKCKNNLIKPMRSIKTQADNPVGLRPHDVITASRDLEPAGLSACVNNHVRSKH